MSSDTETADLSSSGPSAPGVSELAEVLRRHEVRLWLSNAMVQCDGCEWSTYARWDDEQGALDKHRRHVAEVIVIAASGAVVPAAEVREGQPWPDCPDHGEAQRRDGNPPWCLVCGWHRGNHTLPQKVRDTKWSARLEAGEDLR